MSKRIETVFYTVRADVTMNTDDEMTQELAEVIASENKFPDLDLLVCEISFTVCKVKYIKP